MALLSGLTRMPLSLLIPRKTHEPPGFSGQSRGNYGSDNLPRLSRSLRKLFKSMLRIKRNDHVVVLSGKNRGKRGKVLQVIPEEGRVRVEGLNLVKRHMRRSQSNPQGAILSKESPLPLDRVLPICPACNKGVRVGFKVSQDGTKSRICRRREESF